MSRHSSSLRLGQPHRGSRGRQRCRRASALAARLDGRAPFASARVVGLAGEYEALAPVPTSLGGRAVMVGALRDPDTGLLAAAVAFGPDGAPLGSARTRALLRAR